MIAATGEVEYPTAIVLGTSCPDAGEAGAVPADAVLAAVIGHKAVPDLVKKGGAGDELGLPATLPHLAPPKPSGGKWPTPLRSPNPHVGGGGENPLLYPLVKVGVSSE